jgi:hypothetical protein
MDPELRQVYNKFGGDGIKQNRRFDESQVHTSQQIDTCLDGWVAVYLSLPLCFLMSS